jgi:DNA polymerase-3 subunit delta'
MEIAIAQIRDMERLAALQPYEGKHRVFIIDSAEYLNEESSNCLLKTLEEPPPKVLFILLTVNDNMLLPTIVSRCQRIEVHPLPAPGIERALIERWQVASDRARVLSRLCHGSIGWAISAAQDEKLIEERSQRLAELTNLTDESLEQRFSFAARLAVRFGKRRDTVDETLQLWLEWWRDILLVREGCAQLITNVDQEKTLSQHARCYSLIEVRGFIEAIRAASEQLEQNANPRLVLEVLMLNIPNKSEEKDRTPQRSGMQR